MENPEVVKLEQLVLELKEEIQRKEFGLEEKNKEVQGLREKLESVHVDELIQLYQIQIRENEHMNEEIERLRVLLSDVSISL